MLKPDYLGFIFHKGSPRDVTETIDRLDLIAIPASVRKVAVTVDQPIWKVRELIRKHGFEAVQLHGDEDPVYCRELKQECEVIKAFRLTDSLPAELNEYEGNCHQYLFDAKGKYQGGNGIKFNHNLLNSYRSDTPYILSGGIGDDDLEYLLGINFERLAGVDLNSRFELSPGYKSLSSLKMFINKLRSHAAADR